MVRRIKKTKKVDIHQFDFELDEGVTLPVTLVRDDLGNVGFDEDTVEWSGNVLKQLRLWRNIPSQNSINQQDISVKKFCREKGLDSLRPNSRQEKIDVGNVIRHVRGLAEAADNGIVSTVTAIAYFRHAVVIDNDNKTAHFIPAIAKLFPEAELTETIDTYFSAELGSLDPEFPTLSRSLAIEHVIPLLALLLDNFNLAEQLDHAMVAFAKGTIDEDETVQGEETNYEADSPYDDAGFQSD